MLSWQTGAKSLCSVGEALGLNAIQEKRGWALSLPRLLEVCKSFEFTCPLVLKLNEGDVYWVGLKPMVKLNLLRDARNQTTSNTKEPTCLYISKRLKKCTLYNTSKNPDHLSIIGF